MFLNPNNISNFNPNCSNSLDMRNLQEQVKNAFCYQKLFWPFTVWINCSIDLKIFANSQSSASFKSFSWSVEQFFVTAGQNNCCNKIPFIWIIINSKSCPTLFFEMLATTTTPTRKWEYCSFQATQFRK